MFLLLRHLYYNVYAVYSDPKTVYYTVRTRIIFSINLGRLRVRLHVRSMYAHLC